MDIQAVLLCGGKGERLRPFTENIPKPLIQIKNKPILKYIVDHTLFFGINELIVATGYKSGKIESYLEDNYLDYNIMISNSGDVDIIERIKHASHFIKRDFLLIYGDTLSDLNLNDLINYHQSNRAKVTVTVWPLRSQFGVLELDSDGMISSFLEKPVLDKWINIGYFYFENEVLSWMDRFSKFEDFLHYLVEKKELNGYKHMGSHITINTLKELKEAELNVEKLQNSI